MARKIPPPNFLTGSGQEPNWQAFNRWLLEVTSVLTNEGGIDPAEVTGLPALFATVAAQALSIAALALTQGTQGGDITTLQGQVVAINASIATINGQITTLGARGELLFGAGVPAAGLGKVNDWYGDTAGAVGARVFIKKAIGVWTPFPF